VSCRPSDEPGVEPPPQRLVEALRPIHMRDRHEDDLEPRLARLHRRASGRAFAARVDAAHLGLPCGGPLEPGHALPREPRVGSGNDRASGLSRRLSAATTCSTTDRPGPGDFSSNLDEALSLLRGGVPPYARGREAAVVPGSGRRGRCDRCRHAPRCTVGRRSADHRHVRVGPADGRPGTGSAFADRLRKPPPAR
jgi:hypothetical protein